MKMTNNQVPWPKSPYKGDRHNVGKPKLNSILLAPEAIVGLSRRFESGDALYGAGNWKKGLKITELIDSLMRHLMALENGESTDPDMPCTNHEDAVLWNALILSQMIKTRPDCDDRVKFEKPVFVGGDV